MRGSALGDAGSVTGAGPAEAAALNEAIAGLYRSHRLSLLRLAAFLVDDRAVAEELVQDAFAALYQRWGSLHDKSAAPSWLRATVVNGARSAQRRQGLVRRHLRVAEPDALPPADFALLLAEEHREVLAALRRLPRRQREVLVLRYWANPDEAEISRTLRISRGTVRSTASRPGCAREHPEGNQMSTDSERRLRAALEASAELITDPPGSADHQPPATNPDGGRRRGTRRRRPGPWVAPLVAAAAVVVVVAGVTAIVRSVNEQHGPPVSHRSSPVTSAPLPTPAPTSAPARGRQEPPAGPQVIDAGLFAAGSGYVRTQDSLLWTGDLGATWRTITPPGLTPAQLRSAGIALQPDGHEWVAVAPKAGGSTVTVLRRSSATRSWTSTSVPLGALTISPDAAATTSLSFAGPDNGWLLVGEQITHTGSGELLRTADGGATWTRQAGQSALPAVGAIRFLTPQVGYLEANSTGAWWTTRDAGRSWTLLHLPTPAARKSDSVRIIGAPALAGDAVVVAASFTTPALGRDDGVGIYRSTDLGATWTVRPLPSETATEEYGFAAAPDGSSLVLLRSQPSRDLQTFTWMTSRSTDGGRTFTDASSVYHFYPGPLMLADDGSLWTIGGANGCKSLKTGCWSTAGLIASGDGGASWHQVKLPS